MAWTKPTRYTAECCTRKSVTLRFAGDLKRDALFPRSYCVPANRENLIKSSTRGSSGAGPSLGFGSRGKGLKMRILKGVLVLAVVALALTGLASSAIAQDGVIRDVADENIILEGTELHSFGWWKFEGAAGSAKCHATLAIRAVGSTGSTGEVTSFVPDITHCAFTGFLSGCSITGTVTEDLPYHATVTAPEFGGRPAGDIDITQGTSGPIELVQTFAGPFCPIRGVNRVTTSAMTLTPLRTGTGAVTNTTGHLGTAAGFNEAIAGVQLTAAGTLDTPNGQETITISGELELTEAQRCTWRIASS
jgi:hypothetical protein